MAGLFFFASDSGLVVTARSSFAGCIDDESNSSDTVVIDVGACVVSENDLGISALLLSPQPSLSLPCFMSLMYFSNFVIRASASCRMACEERAKKRVDIRLDATSILAHHTHLSSCY